MDVLKVSFKPTGLFLLLNDSDEQKKVATDVSPNPLPSAPISGLDTGFSGNGLESFSAHHVDISLFMLYYFGVVLFLRL